MKKNGAEKNIAVILFVLVMVMFSLAERETKKMERLYTVAQALKNTSTLPVNASAASIVKPAAN